MAFTQGHKLATGRPKGSQNKTTAETKAFLAKRDPDLAFSSGHNAFYCLSLLLIHNVESSLY